MVHNCGDAEVIPDMKDTWLSDEDIKKSLIYNLPSSCSLKSERYIYRVIQEESAVLWEMIVCVILSKKVHMNMGPILNGY